MTLKVPPIVIITLGCLGIWGVSIVWPNGKLSACDDAQQGIMGISCGEKNILDTSLQKPPLAEKQAGILAFSDRKYDEAIKLFTTAWAQEKDPETLIYLNNAKIFKDRDNRAVRTIGIAVPATNTPAYIASGMLKAVAFFQEDWNQKEDRKFNLKVAIADDSNSPAIAAKIDRELIARSDILGIVGHYSSVVTIESKKAYQTHQTPLISGTSTATELTELGNNNFFFRTGSTNRWQAEKIVQSLIRRNHKKIAIFRSPGKTFSDSLYSEIINFLPLDIRIVKEFNLDNRSDAVSELAEVNRLGATTIVLLPDAFTARTERDRSLSTIKANQGKLEIIGDEAVNDDAVMKLAPNLIQKLTIVSPWHSSDRQHINLNLLNKTPNWWGVKSAVSSRIVPTYEAVNVLVTAIDRSADNPTRLGVQKVLADPKAEFVSITGKITFKGSDRVQKVVSLVTPKCTNQSCLDLKAID
jgi:ABC-type branched-subunit amino acid transport system substrate-binding protein